jgi:hypothetical protein
VKITKTSILSGETNTLDLPVTQEQIDQYNKGSVLVQHAFPGCTPEQREFLMTGITPAEWNKAFPPTTTLYLGIPLEDLDSLQEVTDAANEIVTKYGGTENGAGLGFGFRDIDWDFNGKVPQECIDELRNRFPGCRIKTTTEN